MPVSEAKQDKSQLVLPERMNQPAPVRLPAEVSPMALVQIAVQRGDSLDTINKMIELAERVQANQAKQEFNKAFAAFKSEAVSIVKNTEVKSGPLKGMFHANLFDVVSATAPALAKHGLSLSWKTTKDDKDWIEVTATLRHVSGHFETEAQGGGPDTGPGRNAIQARCSTRTYLERYTALAILGQAASDADDDGGGGREEVEPITAEHLDTLDTMIAGVAKNKEKFTGRFTAHLRVNALADLPDSRYKEAVDFLESIRKSQAESA